MTDAGAGASRPRVVIVGAGAAGLMAAGRAAECGARVLVLERGPRSGRKVRICGKGRANVTNIAEREEFIRAFHNGKFLYGAFHRFFSADLLAVLDELGVPTKVERGGRVFPVSDDADDVADALERRARAFGAEFRWESRVHRILAADCRAAGVEVKGEKPFGAQAVILATGGITYPSTGSTGDGYRMARELGHTIVQPTPALAAMVCAEAWPKQVMGLSLRNVKATLRVVSEDGAQKVVGAEFGEMLITHFGVSGPIILTLSRASLPYIGQAQMELTIDLKPALSDEQLLARFDREMTGGQAFKNYLTQVVPRSIAPVIGESSGIPPLLAVRQVSVSQKRKLLEALRGVRLTPVRLRPAEEAIVTAGGVDIREVDPRTMESRVFRGLYLAGEVIDIDATTGGYNLQAAFSTGWVAGENAAKAAAGSLNTE